MKVLIAYSSKYGSTRACAERLEKKIDCTTMTIDVSKSKPDPRVYDAVIIGSPVYMGKLHRSMSSYINEHIVSLLDRPLGIFLCSMDRDKSIEEQLSALYPEKLLDHSSVKKGFGGAYNISNMNFINRFIIKKAAGVEEDKKDLFHNEIDSFAEEFNRLLK